MPFQKGKSGNPGGRLKITSEVVDLARVAGPKAIEKLISLIDHKDARIAAVAAEQVLNRGFGRPAQAVHLSGADGVGPVVFQTFYEEKPRALEKPGSSPPDASGSP